MKALVVGHRGYLGPLVVKHLKRNNVQVHGIDEDWYAETIGNLKGEHVPQNERNGLGSRLFDLDPIGSYDVVIWLAAVSNDHLGELDVLDTNWSNYEQPTNQAQRFWRDNPNGKFIYISSASVYGAGEKEAASETSNTHPLSAYARSKVQTDEWLMRHEENPWVSVRLGTLWGDSPNMRRDLVVNAFVWEAIHPGVIKPKSDARRPILHVDDAAWAICIAAMNPAVRGIFNVCSENVTVYELAKRIGSALNVNVDYGSGDSDKRDYHMDNSKAMYHLEIREDEWKTTLNPEFIWAVEKCLAAYHGNLKTRTQMYQEMLHQG